MKAVQWCRVFLNMKVKIYITMLMLLFTAIASISFITFRNVSKSFEDQARISNDQILEQLALNLDNYLDEIYRLTLIPYYYEGILNLLRKPLPETPLLRLEKRRAIEGFMNSALLFPREDILQVYILSDDA